jgi:hypothetical protein
MNFYEFFFWFMIGWWSYDIGALILKRHREG